MLESLRVAFAGEGLPFDESLTRRLDIAKLIGLAFFYNSNGLPPPAIRADDDEYWQGWRMTREDLKASIMSIFKLTIRVLEGNLPMAVDLATQVFILLDGQLPVAPAWAGEEYEHQLTQRTTMLRETGLLEREEEAGTRWPWKAVATSLLALLSPLYRQIDPPIIAKVNRADSSRTRTPQRN